MYLDITMLVFLIFQLKALISQIKKLVSAKVLEIIDKGLVSLIFPKLNIILYCSTL